MSEKEKAPFDALLHTLARRVRDGITATGRMLAVVLLGGLALVAVALPWLLRAALVFGWVYGTWAAGSMLWTEYASLPPLPRLALMAMVALAAVAGPLYWVVERQREHVWGSLGLTGAALWGLARLYPAFVRRYPVQAAMLPVALAVAFQAYLMVRARTIFRRQPVQAKGLTTPSESEISEA